MNLTQFVIITSYFVCAYALIMNITLMVESEDDIVDGNSLASLNEGAGVNFFFVGYRTQLLKQLMSTQIKCFQYSQMLP